MQFVLCAPMCSFQGVPAVMCPVYWSVVSVRGVSVSRRCSLGVVVSLLLRSLAPVSSFPFQVYPVSRCPCLRIRVSPDQGSFFETQTCTSARAVPQLSIAALRLGLEPRASALNRPSSADTAWAVPRLDSNISYAEVGLRCRDLIASGKACGMEWHCPQLVGLG